MALTRTTPPTVDPLSLDEVKKHLRVSHTRDDGIIALYIKAATDYCDGEGGFLARCIVTQTWRLTLDEFPEAEIKIPLPPLQTVSRINYFDPEGVEQTVNTLNYYVDAASEPGWVVPVSGVSWPTPLDAVNAVNIDFVAGYEPNDDSPADYTSGIPGDIKNGLLLMIGNFYENREAVVVDKQTYQLPMGADMLLRRRKLELAFA